MTLVQPVANSYITTYPYQIGTGTISPNMYVATATGGTLYMPDGYMAEDIVEAWLINIRGESVGIYCLKDAGMNREMRVKAIKQLASMMGVSMADLFPRESQIVDLGD